MTDVAPDPRFRAGPHAPPHVTAPAAPPPSAPAPPVALDPPHTQAGALERLFIAETQMPSARMYDVVESLRAMRFMRQVVENRLRLGPAYGAPRGAKTEIDVIAVGKQFQGFGAYPQLPGDISHEIADALRIANARKDARSPTYRAFIANAILAATEAAPPQGANIPADLVGWKTKGAEPPGPNYVLVDTVQGNDFYSAVLPKAAPRHHR